jgi:hypothetical protein
VVSEGGLGFAACVGGFLCTTRLGCDKSGLYADTAKAKSKIVDSFLQSSAGVDVPRSRLHNSILPACAAYHKPLGRWFSNGTITALQRNARAEGTSTLIALAQQSPSAALGRHLALHGHVQAITQFAVTSAAAEATPPLPLAAGKDKQLDTHDITARTMPAAKRVTAAQTMHARSLPVSLCTDSGGASTLPKKKQRRIAPQPQALSAPSMVAEGAPWAAVATVGTFMDSYVLGPAQPWAGDQDRTKTTPPAPAPSQCAEKSCLAPVQAVKAPDAANVNPVRGTPPEGAAARSSHPASQSPPSDGDTVSAATASAQSEVTGDVLHPTGATMTDKRKRFRDEDSASHGLPRHGIGLHSSPGCEMCQSSCS